MTEKNKELSSRQGLITLDDIIHKSMKRRTVLKGGVGLAVTSILTACGGGSGGSALGTVPRSDSATVLSPDLGPQPSPTTSFGLNFESIATSDADQVVVPQGYSARVLYAYGDPIQNDLPEFINDGTENSNEFNSRGGDHHDGMWFFGMNQAGEFDPNSSDRGVLCVNHENITQVLMHPNGPTTDADGNRTDINEVRKEIRSHGVGIFEIVRDDAGQYSVVRDSKYNRRITGETPTIMSGAARGSELLQTKFSPEGYKGRGTLNNCAAGFTPWGTYLTCEENYDLYFRDERNLDRANSTPEALGFDNFLAGIGIRVPGGLYGWATLDAGDGEVDEEFSRFNVTPNPQTDATGDYRNEGNQYGYVVEIDPFNPSAAPRKRTSMGRFAHEGVWTSNLVEGQPPVFYMGDDDQLQYFYKFVSSEIYTGATGESPLELGDRFLNNGTLFVASFDVDELTGEQIGRWIPLTIDNPDLVAASTDINSQFYNLFDTLDWILIHSRAAAFVAGGTPLDRPEWGAVNPETGEVYFTTTNNSDRRDFDDADADAAAAGDQGSRDEVTEFLADREFGVTPSSPRGPNSDGHIIRLREEGDNPAATSFEWDVFVFGAAAEDDVSNNISGLTADNEFTDPDGLYFDLASVLWIQTDGGQPNGNNQMLAALPGNVGDGGFRADDAARVSQNLRRFLVGPVDCEITGIYMTPDRRSLLINIQHPGDGAEFNDAGELVLTGGWPNDSRDATALGEAGVRARSATIVITRDDGGVIGAEDLPAA